jgi:hypothetical protein
MRRHMTDTAADRKQLLKTARFCVAEQVFNAFAEYAKITASIITDSDLQVLIRATGRSLEDLKQLRDSADDLLPRWDEFTAEQQDSIAFSEELDQVGWLVLDALHRAIHPEEAEEDVKGLLAELFGDKSGKITVISGTFGR